MTLEEAKKHFAGRIAVSREALRHWAGIDTQESAHRAAEHMTTIAVFESVLVTLKSVEAK